MNSQSVPATGVSITVTGTLINAVTDQSGQFTLSGVPTDGYVSVGARLPASSQADSGASAVMPGVLAIANTSTDIGTLYLNAPNGNGCKLSYAVYGYITLADMTGLIHYS